MDEDEAPTDMYGLLDAVEAVIKAADPARREALAEAIDGYAADFPDDFSWAVGPSSPALLHHLMVLIDSACRPDSQSKPRPLIRLVDRKPEGGT